jgi:hypothetical protein
MMQFYGLSYKSKNIAIQIVCSALRSSVTVKKQRFVSLGGNTAERGKWPRIKSGVYNGRRWFLIFLPAWLPC